MKRTSAFVIAALFATDSSALKLDRHNALKENLAQKEEIPVMKMDNLEYISSMTTNQWDLYSQEESLDMYQKAEYLFNQAKAREAKLKNDVGDAEAELKQTQKDLDHAENTLSKLSVDDDDLTVSNSRADQLKAKAEKEYAAVKAQFDADEKEAAEERAARIEANNKHDQDEQKHLVEEAAKRENKKQAEKAAKEEIAKAQADLDAKVAAAVS